VENQKLILLGKVLEDAKTVGEYAISETSSIVCFATKVDKNYKIQNFFSIRYLVAIENSDF
jgi:hypothetical protein